jgi:hypothetical protein
MRKQRTYLSKAREREERLRLELWTRAARGLASGACIFAAIWSLGHAIDAGGVEVWVGHMAATVAFLTVPIYLSIENLREIEKGLADDWRACFEENDEWDGRD